ncbi:hypothetical protein EBZ80_08180 [bacterium]|nr:hypothetical protein [bacterium]
MKINKKVAIAGAMGVALAAGMGACGKVETTAIPKAAQDLTTDDIDDDDLKAGQLRWENMQTALGIKGSALTTPSSKLGTDEMTALLVAEHTKALYATRCASVESVVDYDPATAVSTDGTTAVDAKVYKMKYKLRASASTSEETARTALLVVGNSCSNNCQMVAYGHGGDRGLTYSEIYKTFGALQASKIIVAPTFPGEPLCKTATSSTSDKTACAGTDDVVEAAVGTSIPWDNDVDDLMGVQSCLVKAALLSGSFGSSLHSKINGKWKSTGGSGTFSSAPLTFLAGSSRGALVADLAIARAGAALTATLAAYASAGGGAPGSAAALQYIGTNTGESYSGASAGLALLTATTLPSCSIHNFGPAGSTMGLGRIIAEFLVKGNIKSSKMYGLPGIPQLDAIMADYRNGTIDTDAAAKLIAKRDVPLNSGLMHSALRKWEDFTLGSAATTNVSGKMLIMHGEKDKVVPVSDTQILGNVFMGGYLKIQDSATLRAKTPGFLVTPVVYQFPATADASTSSHHGDTAFATSVAYQYAPSTGAFWSDIKDTSGNVLVQGTTVGTYGSWGTYDGKTPAETMAAWLANGTTGCTL